LIKGVSYRYEFEKKKRDKSYSSPLHETITIINIRKNKMSYKKYLSKFFISFYLTWSMITIVLQSLNSTKEGRKWKYTSPYTI
jgi:hypothetical protein